ncbi:NLP/P60 hydrolase, partial [Pseudooceanicola lipolyticus]
AGLRACGRPCPGDSDLQMQALGRPLPEGAAAQRGDLLFWKGHVAWVADPETLVHANAHHMAVAYEPLRAAVARIAAQGDGPVLAHKRLEH